jgi:hypothetical protein
MTNFFTVVPNICGSSVWKLLCVIFLVSRTLKWLLHFWRIFASLYYVLMSVYIGKSVCEPFGNGHKTHLHQKEIDFDVGRCSELAEYLVQNGI